MDLEFEAKSVVDEEKKKLASTHPMLALGEQSMGNEVKPELLVGYWMLEEYAGKIGMKQFDTICR